MSVMLRRGPGPLFNGEKRKTEKAERRMSLRRRDRQQQSEGLTDREVERYGWQAAITETEAPCEHSQVCACVTVCEDKRGTERGVREGRKRED